MKIPTGTGVVLDFLPLMPVPRQIIVNSHSSAGFSSLHPGHPRFCTIARTVNALMKGLDIVTF